LKDLKKWKKDNLDTVSCTFCVAKWKQVTLHLQNGFTHSCHHPTSHKIPLDELVNNPSALHNTKFKKLQRKSMLEGIRPDECDYCWRVEDAPNNPISDRTYKSAESWAEEYIEEIIAKPWDDDVTPSYLEVSFSSVCNFKCSYCSPQVSSKWMEEIQQHGAYPTSNKFNDITYLDSQGMMPIPHRVKNPYVDAFWKWWPDVSRDLRHFRITGGEPLLSKDTFKILDDLIANPRPNMEFSINSNMCIPDAVFNKFIEKIKIICNENKVKKFKIFTSAEAYGAQAEYIRHGLDYNQWLDNIRRVLREIPNCTFTCTSTYNLLSLFSFDKLLVDILEIKKEFGGPNKNIPIILDTPYLRYPAHQAVFIADNSWNTRYLIPQAEFIKYHLEDKTVANKTNNGFYSWELDKFKRISSILLEENLSTSELCIRRSDFVKFVDEHDKRRGTTFLKTFPEMAEFYKKISNGETF